MAKTYRQGSKGEAVEIIQRTLLGEGYAVTADGDYGPRTAQAVTAFQRQHSLTADGIAGPQTLERLLLGQAITHAPINTHITRAAGRQVKYIALHYTAGTTSAKGAAMQTRGVFLRRNASADFVVDDAEVVQVNGNIGGCYCWAVGDRKNPWTGGARLYGLASNRNTVSIEVCSTLRRGTTAAIPNHEGWGFTERSLDMARRLVRYLMVLYGIPRERVVRHYDITGKLCPGIPGWNDGPLYTTDGKQTPRKGNSREWERFVASI